MRRLILFRHSKTVPAVPAGDHARHLSPRGIAEAAVAGRRLAGLASPELILVSDARRTRETFDRLVEATGREVAHRFEPRLYGATEREILELVADVAAPVLTLLVIGHNPGLGDLARTLAQSSSPDTRRDLDAHFPTSAFAIIALAAPGWADAGQGGRLEAFVTPNDE